MQTIKANGGDDMKKSVIGYIITTAALCAVAAVWNYCVMMIVVNM